jgi:hypothetical protein
MSIDRKGGVGTALSCAATIAEFTAAFWAPWAIGYLVATRAPKSKPAPTRSDP